MTDPSGRDGPLGRAVAFCLRTPLVTWLVTLTLAAWGVLVAPFGWEVPGVPSDPVPVDAIPDTGENQQIVFTRWLGRSPQDVEDQVTYPLTVELLGVPGVKSVRSASMFGVSSIFVVFDDDVEFYWSRSRLLEKLSSMPVGTLPDGVRPTLGPDATPLGQVFWYTLEGHDAGGRRVGGWDLQELRSIQDWTVRYALSSVEGVAEVASIGGFVEEIHVDADPAAMREMGVTLDDVARAVRDSNADVGARTIEVNRVEYAVRSRGLIEDVRDLEKAVLRVADGVPITLGRVAQVTRGPALRRGALDRGGAEAVGGVVVVRYGANPMQVIRALKDRIAELESSLPERTLDDGTVARVRIVPFYDRTELIQETLGTLATALRLEVLVTAIVVLASLAHFGSALLVAGLLPLAVLLTFVGMKLFGVQANVVALSGIAIAIGTMVDVGIVVVENVLATVRPGETRSERVASILRGTREVSGAVLTAILTTVVSFLPVFTMQGAEGKLFGPLAATKTMALVASIVVALFVLPAAARFALGRRGGDRSAPSSRARAAGIATALALAIVVALDWEPLGAERAFANSLFVVALLGGVLSAFYVLYASYESILRWCLAHKVAFLAVPIAFVTAGAAVWLGFARVAPFVPEDSALGRWGTETFPGLGEEFMPRLDEGSFLLMPVTMPHASIGEAFAMLQEQDRAVLAIPEVKDVVGKIGRVESALDPAPVSMVETVVTYLPEYEPGPDGSRGRFRFEGDAFVRDEAGALVPDDDGRPFRNWRPEIRSADDIWDAVAAAAEMPGMTTASKLQPIETRRIMLQTGLRAPFGVKVFGPDSDAVEAAARAIEVELGSVPSIRPGTVVADRLQAKPYLELEVDRDAIARYGLSVRDVQEVVEVAVGGRALTQTIEGRERSDVRVRLMREERDSFEALERVPVDIGGGRTVPLGQLVDVQYRPGPESIKSEDTFLVAYVLFDRVDGVSEVEVVEEAREFLDARVASGALDLPDGVSYRFAGAWENQVRAARTLRVIVPLALVVIVLLLYLQFRSLASSLIVFSGIFVAWAGGFGALWLYGQDWFLAFDVAGTSMRELFQIAPVNLSVAVWVGFLALFGIATDDGVVMTTYLRQSFAKATPRTRDEVREAVVAAGLRRIRPCLMTTATTTLALLPVLASTGKGADVMVPMAIPTVGGMALVLVTVFVVPTLYCWVEERRLGRVATDA